MESAKALRLLSAPNIPNLEKRELSNTSKDYVIPAVYEVRKEKQSAILRDIGDEPIVIVTSGDMTRRNFFRFEPRWRTK